MEGVTYSIDGILRDTVRRAIMWDAAYTLRSHEFSRLGGYYRLLGRLDIAFTVGAVTADEYARLSGDICFLGVNDHAGRHEEDRQALAEKCARAHEEGGWI